MSTGEIETLTRESLHGWVPPLAAESELRAALEQAFDYRGDVTITLKNGETIIGYVFDRRPGKSLADSFVRVLPQESHQKRDIAYADIAALAFTGRDTAAGKSWEAWVQKYWEKKAAGESNIGLLPDEHD
ncbi:MAG: hypothetical protein ABSD13_05605 [Candidatus Korobacteraceae bacterium]|jgi:hypothetical protein